MALVNKLTAIGDAIRNKNGSTDKLTLDAMVTAINNLASVTIDGVKQSGSLDLISDTVDVYVSTLPYKFGGSAVVLNGEIHILGTSSGLESENTNSHNKWNGSSWSKVSTLPYPFYNGSAVVLNGEIHILGSLGSSTYYKHHYKWNGSSWSKVSTLPVDFYNGSAVVLNGEIHIVGSQGSTTAHYKFNGSSWSKVSALPYAFFLSSAVVLNGEIHILGAATGSSNSKKHYKWNGSSWSKVSTLPYEFGGTVAVLNDEIHIFGSNQTVDAQKYHYKRVGSSWIKLKDLPIQIMCISTVVLDGAIHTFGSVFNTSSDDSKCHFAHNFECYKKVG